MAFVCEICGKGPISGNTVSHSNRHSRHSWSPNIQRVRAIVDGKVKCVNVCTRCMRTGKVNRTISK
ncbi:MAG: 50S ribosomal protein L28 [Phascolarctobacterium sp.]|nr:50S ribosomal protein L28 [Phascolarctobacterium sp.]MCD8174644.1 50S ribosomal protein L28 [Phascolarctobacterium sp.]